ncbi:50S ribosomal protein L7/L12 [symbiont of Argiope bruennichi]|uniref:50S ribosomal protein L7/L12 n=1 Tax=symbiont of Argiope bruennichi TaxID=2810479 RepID=UPI003DA3C20C
MENKKIDEILKLIDEMSVLELNNLITSIEEKYNIKAQAMASGSAASHDEVEEKEQKSSFSIFLKEVGQKKIMVIKVVRDIKNCNLMEAKKIVEQAPVLILDKLNQDQVKEVQAKFEEAGAVCEIK